MPARASRRLDVPVSLLVAVSLLALAACGSSASGKASSGQREAFLPFSECMRASGVPNFPDPSGGGGGLKIQIGSGVNPSSPAFQAAQAKCQKLLPGGGPGAGHPTAKDKAQMLAMSECMRAHGVSGFPDPVAGQPPSNPASFAFVIGRDGLFIEVPKTIDVNSPVFKQAAATCGFGR